MTVEECKKECKRLEAKGIRADKRFCDNWFEYLSELQERESKNGR